MIDTTTCKSHHRHHHGQVESNGVLAKLSNIVGIEKEGFSKASPGADSRGGHVWDNKSNVNLLLQEEEEEGF